MLCCLEQREKCGMNWDVPNTGFCFWGFDAVSAAFSRRVDVYLVALEIYV